MRTLFVLAALAIAVAGYVASAHAQFGCGSGVPGCQYQQQRQAEQFNQQQHDLAEGNWRLQQQADQLRLRQQLQQNQIDQQNQYR